ncbi:unnamed protein product [Closterium sp. NIES-53]
MESGQRHSSGTDCAGGNRLVQRESGDNSEVVKVTDTHQVPRERGGVVTSKGTVTGVCSGVRSVQPRKKFLDAPKSRGPKVEAAAGTAAVPAVAAAAAVATATAAATGAAATTAAATTAVSATAAAATTGATATVDAAATNATSKWHVSTGVGASRGSSTSGRTT